MALDSKLNMGFLNSLRLGELLSVKAPDIVQKNAFIHDLNGNAIDCNIYHPKYGYRGFVTGKEQVVPLWNPTIYTEPDTNKKIYCIECLNITCLEQDGTLTNKDGVTVVFVDYVETNRTKRAVSEADFREIYNREFDARGIENTPEGHNYFKRELAEHVSNLINMYKDNRPFSSNTRDNSLVVLGEKFKVFINTYLSTTQEQQEIESLKAAAITETIDLFRDVYKYEPDYSTLHEELTRCYNEYGIKHELKRIAGYFKTNRSEAIEKEIHNHLDTFYREKGKIVINEGGVVSNCKPPSEAIRYCKYAFWELLYTVQLENLQDKIASEHDVKTNTQKLLKVSECSDEYLLDVGVLAKVCKTFNDEIWEDAKESKFLSVFSVGSPYTLNIKQKQKFYALLKCMFDMYKRNGGTLGQSEWVKPLIDKHKLSLSSFDNIGNKLFNKDRKTPIEKAFINRLKGILSIDEK